MRVVQLWALHRRCSKLLCSFAAGAMLMVPLNGHAQELKLGVQFNADDEASWTSDSNWVVAGTEDNGVPGEGEVASIRSGRATVGEAVTSVDALAVRDGIVDIGGGGSLSVAGSTVIADGSAIGVSGNGSLTVGSLANAGTFHMDGKDAVANVEGNFANSGRILLTTSGADPYSLLNVAGSANLSGGTIDLGSTPDGASFDFGNSWAFLKAGSVSGQPSAITVGGEDPGLPRGLGLQVATDGDTSSVTVGSIATAIVDRASGNVSVTNVAGGPLDIQGYSLFSDNGLLSVDNWNGLTDQGVDGWIEANPRAEQLNETNLSGAATLAVGDSVDLGAAWAGTTVSPREEDVAFSYLLSDGRVIAGNVEYTGPANDLVLNVDPESGAATLQNLSASVGDFDVTGFTISSASGSLNPDGFTGIGEDGWEIANPQENALSELNLTGSKVFGNGTVVSLGNIFTPGGAQDLVLEFGDTAFNLLPGTVEFGGGGDVPPPPPAGLPGDIDMDGSVGFADFLVLSANFGMAGGPDAGDIDGDGSVGFPDFLVLSSNFGQSAAAAAVPEPATGILALFGVLGLLKFRRRAPQLCVVLALLAVMSTTGDVMAQTEFDSRFVRLHPEGPNNQINNTTEFRGILDGSVIDVIFNEDITGKLDIIDLAGGSGNFAFIDNPYLNGVSGDGMIDFGQYVSGTLEIPEGEWSIGFGSDDGGFLNMPNIEFIETFNENGATTDGDGELLFNGTRGHGWTVGNFTVPAGGITTPFEAGFFERGGGDSFEVAAFDEHALSQDDVRDLGFELEDGVFDWKVTGDPFGGGVPGDFNGDGVVDTADYMVLAGNLGTGTGPTQGDMNGDGSVDLSDVGAFAAAFPAPAGAAVPEPAGLSMILMAAGLLIGATRRRVG